MSTVPLAQAAERLACSPEHLMRMARKGEVPGAKIGRTWVFLEEDLSALVRSRTPVHIELVPAKRGRRRNTLPRI